MARVAPCCSVLPRLPRRLHGLIRLFRRISILGGPCCPVLRRAAPFAPAAPLADSIFRWILILGGPCCSVLPRVAPFAPAAPLPDSTFPPDFSFGWHVLPRVAPFAPAAPLADSIFPPDFNFGWPVLPRVAPFAPVPHWLIRLSRRISVLCGPCCPHVAPCCRVCPGGPTG